MFRRLITFIPILLLLGSALLLFFINLAGASDKSVLRKLYWSQATTRGISGAPHSVTRWTMYNSCGVSNGENVDCTSNSPAYPFSPKDNFGSSGSLPSSFTKNRDTYFYLSRFAYAFFLIGLVLNIVAILSVFVSCCLSGVISGLISTLIISCALLFTLAASCFITAVHVKGRHNFQKSGFDALLGVKLFAFSWTSVACLLLSLTIMPIISGVTALKGRKREHPDSEYEKVSPSITSSNSQIPLDEPRV